MRSEDLCAMKVKPMLSVRTSQSRCLLFPWCTRAPLQVAGVALCVHEHGSLLSTACVFCLAWFVLLSAEDGLTWLSVIVWFTTHLLLLISQLLLSGMLREILFSQGGLSFLFMKKLMSSPHLIHLTILFSSDSGLLLCPQVTFFNIEVHHPWLLRLKGVGKRQTNSTFLKAA